MKKIKLSENEMSDFKKWIGEKETRYFRHLKGLKEIILDLIYGKKCPICGHRNHSYLLDDNSFSYGVYLHKCDKCEYKY